MAEKIGAEARASRLRNPIRGRGLWKGTTSRPPRDTPHTHLANDSRAAAPDVRPYGTRTNRNAEGANVRNDRTFRNSRADRTKIFYPDNVSDDPRRRSSAEGSQQVPLSHVAALASDAIVPDALHDLARWPDTDPGLSITASDAQLLGRLRCNSVPAHSPVESDGRSLSASNCAIHCDRPELVSSNNSEHLEVGPRELLSRKVKSRIEAANFSPRRFFPRRYRHDPATPPYDIQAPCLPPLVQPMAIGPWLINSDTMNEVAEISWPLTAFSIIRKAVARIS